MFASLIDGFIGVLHRAEGMTVQLRGGCRESAQMKVTGGRREEAGSWHGWYGWFGCVSICSGRGLEEGVS